MEVPGTAALNPAGAPGSTRCRAPRRATAAPAGTTRRLRRPAGVRGQRGRRHLGQRMEVPGTAALNAGGEPPSSTRCRAPRRATAAPAGSTGTAPASAGVRGQPGERHLGPAQVPGTAASTRRACRSSRCRARRRATAAPAGTTALRAFVVSQVNGTWGQAVEVPGLRQPRRALLPWCVRCRARRQATAAPAAITRMAPWTGRDLWSAR